MKELTNDDLDELVDGSVFGDWRGYAREVIAADRALNAPAGRDVMREALQEMLDSADEWSSYVEVDNAPRSLLAHLQVVADRLIDVASKTVVKVSGTEDAGAMNAKHGEAYGHDWQYDAAPKPPAEQGEQYPVAQVLPGNGFLAEVPNGLPPGTKLYTHPAPDVLATLRAKVEGLPVWIDQPPHRLPTPCMSHADVLALIDKMGGEV